MKTSEQYEKRIRELEKEVEYLHQLLDKAGICYDSTLVTLVFPDEVTENKVRFFYSMFRGRNDVFVKRGSRPNPRTGKVGYYTQCVNFWKDGICARKTGANTPCRECRYLKYRHLTGRDLQQHLEGKKEDCSDVIGLYAMWPDETCYFLVFDFDDHDSSANSEKWKLEVDTMRRICEINHVPCLTERSRSGNGVHIWFFFSEPVPATLARSFGTSLLDEGASSVSLDNFHFYDRMIPVTDHLQTDRETGKKGLGNLIALPLQGRALAQGNSAFVDENWNVIADQWNALKSVKKMSREYLEQKISEWHPADIKTDSKEKPWEIQECMFEKSDADQPIQVTVSDRIYIDTDGLKPRLQNRIRRMATFSNPEFYKKYAMGFSTAGVPRIVYCGFDEGKYICLPRGLLGELIEKLKEADIPCRIHDLREQGKDIHVSFNGKLYPEQQKAADSMLDFENGILAATTAFGKTVVGAYMIGYRKVNTLIIVHNTEILANWVKDLDRFLDIQEVLPEMKTKTGRIRKRKTSIGMLYGGHDSLTGVIDVAIVSSLGKNDEINPILNRYGMVIMDECHHAAAGTIMNVIGSVNARYLYGLSATPKRDDGMEKKVFMLFGPVRYRYTAKQRALQQGILHYVYPRFTRLVCFEKNSITELNTKVAKNEERNEMIYTDVRSCLKQGRTPLVLTKHRKHAEAMYEALQNDADHVFLLIGGGSKKKKEEIRKQMEEVKPDESAILVATSSYIGEGFNFPRLDTLMLTMPVAWEGCVEQFAGRLHRDYVTKKEVIIYDYVDVHIGMLERMYYKRLRAYKKIGYEMLPDPGKGYRTASLIYDRTNYTDVYEKDLEEARHSIYISSPGLSKNVVSSFVEMIRPVQEKGVRIIVKTLKKEDDSLVQKMRNVGIDVYEKEKLYTHFAIIDEDLVWYGTMNLLSYVREDDCLIRIHNKDAAIELISMKDAEEQDV